MEYSRKYLVKAEADREAGRKETTEMKSFLGRFSQYVIIRRVKQRLPSTSS